MNKIEDIGIAEKRKEINKAKNVFINWLNENDAENIDIFTGEVNNNFNYYKQVSAFIGETIYTVYFMLWNDKIKIDYSDETNRYEDMSIEEFYQLFL